MTGCEIGEGAPIVVPHLRAMIRAENPTPGRTSAKTDNALDGDKKQVTFKMESVV
jgi:hypothetical protein